MLSQCAVSVAAWRFLPSRMRCNSKERDAMGDLYRQVGMSFNVLAVHVFTLWRKRDDSPDTCVACVNTWDGPALAKLALQVEPRRPCR